MKLCLIDVDRSKLGMFFKCQYRVGVMRMHVFWAKSVQSIRGQLLLILRTFRQHLEFQFYVHLVYWQKRYISETEFVFLFPIIIYKLQLSKFN